MKKRKKFNTIKEGFWGWFFSISYTIFLILFSGYMSELPGRYIFVQGLVFTLIYILSYKLILKKSWLNSNLDPLVFWFWSGVLLSILIYFLNNYFFIGLSYWIIPFFWNLTMSIEEIFNLFRNKKTDKLDKIDESREKTRENVKKTNLSDRL